MHEEDRDYTLSFAVPLDAPGLRVIAKQAGRPGDAGQLAEAFANHHRHSCIGCRAGLGDMIIGGVAAIASDNGLQLRSPESPRLSSGG